MSRFTVLALLLCSVAALNPSGSLLKLKARRVKGLTKASAREVLKVRDEELAVFSSDSASNVAQQSKNPFGVEPPPFVILDPCAHQECPDLVCAQGFFPKKEPGYCCTFCSAIAAPVAGPPMAGPPMAGPMLAQKSKNPFGLEAPPFVILDPCAHQECPDLVCAQGFFPKKEPGYCCTFCSAIAAPVAGPPMAGPPMAGPMLAQKSKNPFGLEAPPFVILDPCAHQECPDLVCAQGFFPKKEPGYCCTFCSAIAAPVAGPPMAGPPMAGPMLAQKSKNPFGLEAPPFVILDPCEHQECPDLVCAQGFFPKKEPGYCCTLCSAIAAPIAGPPMAGPPMAGP